MGGTRWVRLTGVIVAAGLSAACQTLAATRPAMLEAPDATCRAQLKDAVATALGGPATLTPSALTQTDTLYVRRGQSADGLDRETPEAFRLTLSRGACVLTHDRTGKAATLGQCNCR